MHIQKYGIFINDGVREFKIDPHAEIPNGYIKGRLAKGTVWVNDGRKQMMVKSNKIPEGFTKGRLDKTTAKKIWVNNGIDMKMVYPDEIPDGYSAGMLESVCEDRKRNWHKYHKRR